MNFLYPSFSGHQLARMLGMTCFGALLAGGYGIFHDQVTFTISPEYFTEMKFEQFAFANFGFPQRVFVAEIGFLATWWVGLLSGWLLARLAYSTWSALAARRQCWVGFSTIIITTFTAGLLGYVLGRGPLGANALWREAGISYGVKDLPAFLCVAAIHYASYFGGALGLVIALVRMWRARPAG